MLNTLFIPKTITVGFQTRGDTFTGKLAYVIYTDQKGVLRKQKSWDGWRDHKIATITVDNTPQPNFTFNKGVKRDGHWGSGRSVIRVWDPRDFEFEISVDNLIGVLMHSDVSKRDIVEPCVYAWAGTELVLLPTNSLEYQESMKHTAKQSNKVSAKELVVGHSYSIKADSTTTMVYLGRLPRYTFEDEQEYGDANMTDSDRYHRIYGIAYKREQKEKKAKGHVFINVATNRVEIKDPTNYLSACIDDQVYPQLADLLDTYYHSAESQPIAGIRLAARTFGVNNYYRDHHWHQINDTDFVKFNVENNKEYDHDKQQYRNNFKMELTRYVRWDDATKTALYDHEGRNRGYGYMSSQFPDIKARVLPGLDRRDPSLLALGKEMLETYIAAYNAHAEANPKAPDAPAWSTIPGLEQAGSEAVQRTHNTSTNLAFLLQDGKVATDHQI